MLDRTFALAVNQMDPPVGRLGQGGIGHIGPLCDDAPYRPMPAVIRRQRRRQSRSRPGIVVVNQQKMAAGQSQQDGRSSRARQAGVDRFRPASAVIVGHTDPMVTTGSASHYRQKPPTIEHGNRGLYQTAIRHGARQYACKGPCFIVRRSIE